MRIICFIACLWLTGCEVLPTLRHPRSGGGAEVREKAR